MAVVLGTSSGFVTVAPTVDPNGTGVTIDGSSVVTKDTSPSTAVRIVEIGWYRATGTNAANWEIGLYAESGGVAATRLFVDATNSSGSSGWLAVTVDWTITGNTAYWLAVQMDSHSGSSTIDSAASGGAGSDIIVGATTLPDPYGGGAVADADGMYAIYAIWQAAATDHTVGPNDSLALSDAAAIGQGKAVADTLALTDASSLGQGKGIADAMALADEFTRVHEAARSVDDSLALTDALAVGRGSVLADTLSLSDLLTAVVSKTVQIDDSVALADARGFNFDKALADLLALTDEATPDLVVGGQSSYSTIDPSRIGEWA